MTCKSHTARTLRVQGIPRPKGSKRAFVVKPKVGKPRAVLVEQGGDALAEWMHRVRQEARWADVPMIEGPVSLAIEFRMPRPKAHFKKDGTLRPDAPELHTKAPDSDKLARAVFDALQGTLFRDDSQVWSFAVEKLYESSEKFTGALIGWHVAGGE